MSEESDVPKELLESVRDAVGKKVKLTLKKKVKLEVRGDKLENRVLALAAHRAFLLTARVPSKIEQTFNYLDIQGITSNKPSQLVVEYDKGHLPMKFSTPEEVDEVIGQIGLSLQDICPGLSPMKVMKKVSLKPAERLTSLQAGWENYSPTDAGPCGGFSNMYWCLCDQLGLPYREEVQWDVDTIYLSQDTRELNLQDFIHLDNRDLLAIIAVLEYNQWFTKLSLKDYKLSADMCDQILKVVARSSQLEELVLENTGLKFDFAQKLASILTNNPNSALHTLNLTNNSLEDKGITVLSPLLAKLKLRYLNLSKNSLSAKGVNILAQSLCANPIISNTLTHLDLSGNGFRGDDIPHLWNFLGQPNCLENLDLSYSDCPLDLVCSSLLRGSLKHLSVLHMSKSVFCHKKGRDIPSTFKQFFNCALSLSSINLSGTKLPLEALKSLLLGLASNPNLKDISLDLSSCELRSAGAQILEGCIAEIPNICSLDISDNGLDLDLTTLLVWLSKNRSVRHLSLGKNFNNIKPKNVGHVLNNLVHLIQEEDSPLTSLSLADSKLKGELSIVLNALGSNSTLTQLDISGNAMGDMGAKMLAKALQINTKLRTVIWDKNNVSPQGLQDVSAALEKNYTIRFMPVPIIDAAQALKSNPEKTEDALFKMEQYLLRNHETRRYLQEQAYRLQQGIVTSTTQQMIDRMCVKVQDHLNSLRYTEADPVLEDMRAAENLMKDARNSKTLLPSMYHLRAARRDGEVAEGPCVGAIRQKLESMAGEVTTVIDEQLQGLLLSMVETAESLCPHVMDKTNLRQELIKASAGKMAIPRDFVTATLIEQSAVDIINKISEVKLSMASFLSDRIVDEILESLSHSQHTLADHLSRPGQPLLHQDSDEPEVVDERVLQPDSQQQPPEPDPTEELDTCLVTPKSKRKSILVRMMRPVSVAFEMEFDLDKALEDVPIHVEDPPPPPPPRPTPERRPSLGFGELPSLEDTKLEHITKLRPRKYKKNKPSKPPSTDSGQEVEENGIVSQLDEGMEEFYSKRVTKIGKSGSIKSPGPLEGERRRESRMSGFFNLIKPRSSKSDKTPTSSPISTQPVVTPTTDDTAPPHKAAIKSHVPSGAHDPIKTQPLEQESGGNSEAKEEPVTSDPKDEHSTEKESQSLPMIGKHIGIPVMGSGLMAEMLARQEKMAQAHKTTDSPAASSTQRHDSADAGSPDSSAQKENRPNPMPRTHPPPVSVKHSSPVPKPKPPLGPRTSEPFCPSRAAGQPLSSDESPELPGSNSSPKAPVPAPRHEGAMVELESSSPVTESHAEGESHDAPEVAGESGMVDAELDSSRSLTKGRQWSSLHGTTNPAEESDKRDRTRSLPAPVRLQTSPDTTSCVELSSPDSDTMTSDPEDDPPEGISSPESSSPSSEDQTDP